MGARRRIFWRRPPRWAIAIAVLLIGAPIAWLGCRSHSQAPRQGSLEAAWIPPHPSDRWQCIVIHHSASEIGGAARFDQWHRAKGWDELGYHFVIGNGSDTRDGQVEIGPRWTEQKHGAHCKTPDEFYNQHGIGICLVGNFDNHDPSPAQLASLAQLCRFLCDRFHIPVSHIYTHGGVTGKTDCPGKRFDLAAVRRRVANPKAAG